MIETADLIFRPIDDSDTDDIIRLRNNKNVKDNFIYKEDITREDHINWLRTKVDAGKVVQFVIISRETGRIIGSVYLRDVDIKTRSAEFGIFIGDKESCGKGYGTRATEFMLDHFFENMNYEHLMLRVLKKNKRAFGIYEKAGFRITEEKGDVIFMSMSKNDFLKRKKQ